MDDTAEHDIHIYTPRLSEFPENHQNAALLGIAGNGHAAYLSAAEIFFAGIDETGALQVPPPRYGRAHGIDLTAFDLSVAEALEKISAEHGDWRALTDIARRLIDPATAARLTATDTSQ